MKYLDDNHFLYGNKGSVWSDKVHIAKTSDSTTLCGTPMLATNYASVTNQEKAGCKECKKLYKLKDYTIREKKGQGRIYNTIRFTKNGKSIFEKYWKKGDEEAEKAAIRSADLCVIKHNLNYRTRKLKRK